MLPDGTVFEYQSTDWSVTFASGPQEIISRVASNLQSKGLYVRANSYKTPSVLAQIYGDAVGSYKYSVDMQVQIENGVGFASVDDAASIIDHEVYVITGNLPTHSVPNFDQPNVAPGLKEVCGQPNCDQNNPNRCLEDVITCWFKKLTLKGMYALAIIGLVAIGAVSLILYRGRVSQ